jgi:hypothetical protein
MTRAGWLFLAALPLAAQPKLLVNAQTDVRSASAGLDREVKTLQSAQPQPAWIGWSVSSVRSFNMGCDYVRDGGNVSGVVHLEPPTSVIVLVRVEAGAITRVRSVSPNCEIDAGGVPLHWLNDVQPPQSIAYLLTLVPERERIGDGALSAVAMHADPAADQALERFLAADQPQSLRQRVVSWEGSYRGKHGLEILKKVISSDTDERVRERAVSALNGSREPEALDLIISLARTDANPRLRAQAVSGLNRKDDKRVLETLTWVVENDKDVSVRRRAVSALQSLPDGIGIPVLIQVARRGDPEIRKQAMSSLGGSRDPRATAFFEEVLKK